MRRRDFNMLLGGAAVALPCAALAQQPAVPVIGFLNTGLTSDAAAGRVAAFQQGLAELGFVAGQNAARYSALEKTCGCSSAAANGLSGRHGRIWQRRSGGRPTVESALRLDIDSMMCWGAIQPGFHRVGKMQLHQFYGDDIDVKFESLAGDPWHSWLRLRYSIADYWSGEELKIDDKVYLAPTRPHFGGLRWWFVYLQRKSPARAAGLEVLGLVSKAECALHLAEIRAPALDPHKKC
jgi:hypothetical protein